MLSPGYGMFTLLSSTGASRELRYAQAIQLEPFIARGFLPDHRHTGAFWGPSAASSLFLLSPNFLTALPPPRCTSTHMYVFTFPHVCIFTCLYL